MPATFGCPECGEPIVLPGHSAGRRVRCAECLTLVEVPYFTRPKPKRKRRRATGWAWVAITLGLAAIVMIGTYLLVRSRLRAERLIVFERLVETARRQETSGDIEAARSALDRALTTSEGLGQVDRGRLDALRSKRVDLEQRIKRAERERLIVAAKADMTVLDDLLSKPSFPATRALELATRAFETAQRVADPRAETIRLEAKQKAAQLVKQRGVRFEPVAGTCLFDPRASRAELMRRIRPIVVRALEDRGYLPEPLRESPLAILWEQSAPFRVRSTINETYGLNYLQSANRTTRIEAVLTLVRGGAEELWRTREVAKTRVPARSISAFESGYLGVSPKREEAIERKLYEDALEALVEGLPSKMENLPAWRGE